MKNQALTTTLAVLLAVSLSALVALIVSAEVIGARPAADAPRAVEVQVVTPAAPAVSDTPATDAPAPDTTEDAPQTPAPGDDNDDNQAVTPGDNPATPDDDTNDNDNPATGEPPCDGEIVDGECIPPNSILCATGYELVGEECEFVGCPIGYLLNDTICEPLVFQAPCDDGFHRVNGVCILDIVVFPGQFVPICPDGQHNVDGDCVPDYKVNPGIVIPGLELAAEG